MCLRHEDSATSWAAATESTVFCLHRGKTKENAFFSAGMIFSFPEQQEATQHIHRRVHTEATKMYGTATRLHEQFIVHGGFSPAKDRRVYRRKVQWIQYDI